MVLTLHRWTRLWVAFLDCSGDYLRSVRYKKGNAMKRAIAFAAIALFAPLTLASTPVLDARQENQQDRIEQGSASGELTAHEAATLEAQQQHIENKEDRAKADGVVNPRERAALQRSQDRASKKILQQKHDQQDRH